MGVNWVENKSLESIFDKNQKIKNKNLEWENSQKERKEVQTQSSMDTQRKLNAIEGKNWKNTKKQILQKALIFAWKKEYSKKKYEWDLSAISTFDVIWWAYSIMLWAWALAGAVSWNAEMAILNSAGSYILMKNLNNEINWEDFEKNAISSKEQIIKQVFNIKNEKDQVAYTNLLSQYDTNQEKSNQWFSHFLTWDSHKLPEWKTQKEFLSKKLAYITYSLKWSNFMKKDSFKEEDLKNLFSRDIPEEYKASLIDSVNLLKENKINSFDEFHLVNLYLVKMFWWIGLKESINRLDTLWFA